MKSPLLRPLAHSIATLALAVIARGAVDTWVGNTSVNWNDLNWTGGNNPPFDGDSFVFGVAGTAGTILNNDLLAGFNLAGITFDAGASAFTFAGNAVTLTGNVTNNSAVAQTINFDQVLAATRVFTTTAVGADLRLGGVLSGLGGVSKLGAGTLILANPANTYTGETIFGPGVINVATLADYGVPSSLGARGTTDENGTVTGISLHFQGGTLQYTGSTPQSTNRQIRILGGGVLPGVNNTIDASGSDPSATLSFTKSGANINLFDTGGHRTLTLTGTNTGANSFSIRLTDQNATTGLTTLQKAGFGTWFITNSDNTHTGEMIFAGGILNVASVSDYGVPSSIGSRALAGENTTVTGVGMHFRGGTLQYTGTTPQSTNRHIRILNANGATLDASGANSNATLSFTRTGPNINLFDTPGVRTLTLTGTNTGANSFSILLADQATSPTSVLKTGPGTWVLNGPDTNTATGTTTVLNGILVLGKTNALAVSGQLILGDGSNQAVAQLGGTGGNQIVDTGIISFGGQGVLRMNNLTETVAGLNGGIGAGIVENEAGAPGTGTLTLNVPTATAQNFGGIFRDGDGTGIDGTLALTKVGGGTLTLFGASTHTGATTVSGGTLTVAGSLTGATVNVNGAVVDGAGAISGIVTIGNAGTVRSTGTLTGTVNVNGGGTLAGTSTTNGTVNVASGGHVSPAGETAPGTLTIGTLSLSAGALIDLELGGVGDLVTITTAGGLVLNGGAFNLFDVGGLNPLSVNGTYVLLDYTANFTGLLGNLSIANSQVGKFYTIDDDSANTRITLTMANTTVTEWNGAGATGLWTTNGNWTLSAPNAPGAVAKFGPLPATPTAVAVDGAKTVGGILFDNVNSYTVSGGAADAITLSNGVAAASITVSSGNHTLAAPLTLVSSANATTAAGTTLTIAGIISGARSLIASGTGTTILSGTNSYVATTISGGTLTIGNAGTTGTLGTGDVNISTGAALVFNRSDDVTVANNIFGSGAQVTKLGAGVLTLSGTNNFATDAGSALNLNTGTIRVGAAGALGTAANLNFAGGALDLNGNDVSIATLSGVTGGITDTAAGAGPSVLTVTQSVATTFSGNIANGPTRSVAVTKSGNGALTLTGANTFSGPLTITNGAVIAAGSAGNIPIPSNVTFGNGTNPVFLIAGAFDPQFGANTAINFNNGSVNAKFLLRGSNQTIAGLDSTADPSITLAIVENDEAGSPGFVGAPGLATLTLNTTTDHSFAGLIRNQVGGGLNLVKEGPATQEIRNALIGANAIATLTINAGRMLFNYVPNGNVTNVLPATTSIVINQATLAFDGNETVAAVISGNGTVLRQGTGTVRIDSANTFTGTTIIQDGTIEIGNDFALGNSIITMNGGIIRAAGALRNLANPVVVNNSFTLGRLTHLNGGLTLNADATMFANNFDGPANNVSNISAVGGNFRLTLAQGPQGIGTGALVFTGLNTNSGGTTVASGRVNVNAGAALANADLTVNGGELNLNNTAQTIASLNGSGGTVNLSPGHTLVVDQTVASTFAGVLANAGGLTKSGVGTLTLVGTNTYTGATTVNGGALLVSGALNGSINVNVATGGTLGGTGTINAPAFTTIAAGGTLAPGAGAGTLTFLNAALNLTTGANYQYDAGPLSDATSLFGAISSLTITDTWTLKLANLGVIPNGLTFILFDGDLFAPQLNGGLVGMPTIDYGATGWSGGIVTFDPAGNDIILTGVIPEPTSLATLSAALALTAGLRRRRAV